LTGRVGTLLVLAEVAEAPVYPVAVAVTSTLSCLPRCAVPILKVDLVALLITAPFASHWYFRVTFEAPALKVPVRAVSSSSCRSSAQSVPAST
jgi:hypothetical protein